MADEKKPKRKPRNEVLYDHKDSKEGREAAKKPERTPAREALAERPAMDEDMTTRHGRERVELHLRHRNERRGMAGEHRGEHDEMHDRHETEMKEAMRA